MAVTPADSRPFAPDDPMPAPVCPACGWDLPTPVPARCPVPVCGHRLAAAPAARPRPVWLIPAVAGVAVAAGVVGGWVVFRPRPQPPADERPAVAAVVPPPPAPAAASPTPPAPPAALSGEQVYQRLLKVSALILTADGLGSGVVVDADRRLVLTNAHVVSGRDTAAVVFPAHDAGGAVLTEAARYPDLVRKTGSPARVIARRPLADLALLELECLPAGVRAVAVGGGSAPTGARVYSVGNSGALSNGHLWRLTDGTVRGRGRQEYRDGDGQRRAVFLETTAPVNPGDSGGPVVDNRGRLVGLVASFERFSRGVSANVDAEEVRAFLADAVPAANWAWADPAAPAGGEDEVGALRAALSGPPPGRVEAARKLVALGSVARPALPDLLRALAAADADTAAVLLHAAQTLGPPTPADGPAVERLLTAAQPAVRQYAVGQVAGSPSAVGPAVAGRLTDEAAAVRLAAVRRAGQLGPAGQNYTLAALVGVLADPDPGVATAVAELVGRPDWVAAYDTAALPALRPALSANPPAVRALVARLVGPLQPDAGAAVADLGPLCDDPAASVRAAALSGLARWGRSASAAGPAVARRLDDPEPAVRRAAVPLLAAVAEPAELVRVAGRRYLAEPDAEARVALGRVLVGLGLSAADPAVVARLTASPDPETVRGLLDRLARHPAGVATAAAVLARTDLPDDVRATAVTVLGAAGPAGAAHGPAVVRYVRESKAPTAVTQRAAAKALGQFGPAGVPLLADLLDWLDDAEAVATACDGFAAAGPKAAGPAAVPWMAARAERLPAAREAAGRALAGFGGDAVTTALVQRAKWTGTREVPAAATDMRAWVYAVLARIDPKTLSTAERERLDRVLFAAKTSDPAVANRAAAEAAWGRLRPRR